MRGEAPPLPSPTGEGVLPGRVIVVGLSTTLGVAGQALIGRVKFGPPPSSELAGQALIGRVKFGSPPSSELAEVGL